MNGPTARILKNSSQLILNRWEEEVRNKIPAARVESKISLRDSIPDFLQDLILALDSNFSEHSEDFLRFAHKHGKERANDSSFSIEDAITEYNILRRVIFSVLEDQTETISARDRDIIYEAISLALAKAGAEYAKAQIQEVEAIKRRLQLITDIQPTLIVYIDKDMNYLFANQTYGKWFHVAPSEIVGMNLKDVVGDVYEELRSKIEEAFQGKNVRFKSYVNFPDGRKFVDITYQPHLDDEGKVKGIFVSVDDRTEEKNKLDELRKEQDLRDKFISTLSHDLRTPLTASKMSAQIIARKITDTSIHTHTNRIVDNINRADKLIQDLLDASRIRAGKMSLPETENFDLIQLVHTTLDDLTTIHGERFKFTGPERLEVNLHPDGIRRIIENLCSNAIKYGSTYDPVRLKIERKGDHFILSVCNTGNPLITIDREKLFEPFEQGHSTGKNGWGIGLTIVKGISEAHGGNVKVESDGNTTFTVNLPVNAAPFIENHLH